MNNKTYSVFITESDNTLAHWMDSDVLSVQFHGLTLEEATFLSDLCDRQQMPHDALIRIENNEY